MSETSPSLLATGTTTMARKHRMSAVRSWRRKGLVFIASLGGEEAGGPVLQEEDHEAEEHHLGVHALQERLEELVEAADAEPGDDRARQLAHAAGDDHHEGVDDVDLAHARVHVSDLGQR